MRFCAVRCEGVPLIRRKEEGESLVFACLAERPGVGLDVGVFGDGVEAGALLDVFTGFYLSVLVEVGTEVTMSHDFGLGELVSEAHKQGAKRIALCSCPGVGWVAVGIQSSFVGYADGCEVVAFGVCAGLLDGAHVVGYSVGGDVVMIAASGEAALAVGGFQCRRSERTVGTCGGAVDDDSFDWSHNWVMSFEL